MPPVCKKTGLSASISQKHAKYFTVPYKASLKVFSRLLAFDCVHSNLEEKYTMKRETDEYVGICVCLYLWHCIYATLYVPVILWCRTDEEKRRYTGVLCGLGWDVSSDEGDSVFPDHDMEITFDSSFDLHDLQLVSAPYFCIICSIHGTYRHCDTLVTGESTVAVQNVYNRYVDKMLLSDTVLFWYLLLFLPLACT